MSVAHHNPQQEEEIVVMVSNSQDSSGGPKYVYISPIIDYYPEAGSLFIKLDEKDDVVLESDALVLIGLRNNRISSIEVLLRDKDVIKKLSHLLKGEYSDR